MASSALRFGRSMAVAVHAARAQAVHERGHARRRPARAVSEEAPDRHRGKRSRRGRRGVHRSWPGRVMAGRSAGAASSSSPHKRDPCRPPRARAAPRRDRPTIVIGVVVTLLVVLLGSLGGGHDGPRCGPERSAAELRSDAVADPDADSDPPPADAHADPAGSDGPRLDRHLLRSRLRPRRRDVAVRRARACPRRPGRDDDPRPLLPRHDARLDPDHDPDPRPRPVSLARETERPAGRRRPSRPVDDRWRGRDVPGRRGPPGHPEDHRRDGRPGGSA